MKLASRMSRRELNSLLGNASKHLGEASLIVPFGRPTYDHAVSVGRFIRLQHKRRTNFTCLHDGPTVQRPACLCAHIFTDLPDGRIFEAVDSKEGAFAAVIRSESLPVRAVRPHLVRIENEYR